MTVIKFPDEKKFAFSIVDDADVSQIEVIRPVYALLAELGIAATKIVWSNAPDENRAFDSRCTLEDPEYCDFILELHERGFEIGWAGASRESNTRERTIEGLERFREVVGYYPRVQVNGVFNRESMYWGMNRIDQPLLKAVVQRAAPTPPGYFLGHVEGSPFWWGDVCLERVDYVMNLTFDDVNLSRINPSMPYHDPSRPFVRSWFSASDAESCTEFNQLLRPDRLEKLERDGGCCIVATRLSKGFMRNRQIDRLARKRLEALAAKSGWFVPVSTLLDHLRDQSTPAFSIGEWDRMQWKWARDLVRRRVRNTARRDPEWLDAAIS